MINVTNINTVTTRYLDFSVSIPNGKTVSLKNVSENDLRDVNDALYDLVHFDPDCGHYLPLDGDITVPLNGDGDEITITIWEGDSDGTVSAPFEKVIEEVTVSVAEANHLQKDIESLLEDA